MINYSAAHACRGVSNTPQHIPGRPGHTCRGGPGERPAQKPPTKESRPGTRGGGAPGPPRGGPPPPPPPPPRAPPARLPGGVGGLLPRPPYAPPPIKKQGVNPFFPFIVVVSWGTLRLPPASTKGRGAGGAHSFLQRVFRVTLPPPPTSCPSKSSTKSDLNTV